MNARILALFAAMVLSSVLAIPAPGTDVAARAIDLEDGPYMDGKQTRTFGCRPFSISAVACCV